MQKSCQEAKARLALNLWKDLQVYCVAVLSSCRLVCILSKTSRRVADLVAVSMLTLSKDVIVKPSLM